MISLNTGNLQYILDYDYDWHTNCYEEGCDDICRCGRIENFRIENLNFSDLFITDTPIEAFAVWVYSRILEAANLDTEFLFDVDIHHSYYGEEVFGITLNTVYIESQPGYFDLVNCKDDVALMNFALGIENPGVDKTIKSATYIAAVPINKVKVGTKTNSSVIIGEYLRCRNLKELPVVIDEEFRLFDGNHKLAAKAAKGLRKTPAIQVEFR